MKMSMRRIFTVKLLGKEFYFRGLNILVWPFVSIKDKEELKPITIKAKRLKTKIRLSPLAQWIFGTHVAPIKKSQRERNFIKGR